MVENTGTTTKLAGTLLRLSELERAVLIVGADPDVPGKLVYQGEMIVRFALAFLYEADYFIPERVIDDFRRQFAGLEAYRFLLDRGDSFPRADVIGTRVATGAYDEIFLKQLDLAAPLAAFAYSSPDADVLLAPLDAVIWIDDTTAGWSEIDDVDHRASILLRDAVPCFRVGARYLAELSRHLQAALR